MINEIVLGLIVNSDFVSVRYTICRIERTLFLLDGIMVEFSCVIDKWNFMFLKFLLVSCVHSSKWQSWQIGWTFHRVIATSECGIFLPKPDLDYLAIFIFLERFLKRATNGIWKKIPSKNSLVSLLVYIVFNSRVRVFEGFLK